MTTSPANDLTHSPLAERFWGLARMRDGADGRDPRAVVRHVLDILDALDAGERGDDISVNTLSFLHLLRQSEIEGDLLYASPEQARGEQMDERSLVFSVGVLIFEKLTGRHPFGAEGNPRRLARIQKAEMASGVNYFQTINGPLRPILLKCMGPFPEERWKNMRELRAQLEAFERGALDPQSSRSLPALPVDPHAPAVSGLPGGRASAHALGVAAQREVGRRHRSIAIPQAPDRRAWLQRGIWMASGAAVAVLLFVIAGIGSDDSPDAAAKGVGESGDEAAAADRERLQGEAPAAAAAHPPEGATAAPAPKPKDAADPVAAAPAAASGASEVEVAPLAFDADELGDQALAAIALCGEAEGLPAEVGATLIVDPGDGAVRRVFLGSKGMSAELRRCLHTRLADLVASAPPEGPMSIAYRFRPADEKVMWKEIPPGQK